VACTPLNIDAGLFITTSPWETTPTKSFDGKTVTLTTSGGSPGISVVKSGGGSLFHAQLANRVLHYGVLGNKYLLILDVDSGVGPSTRSVSLVNFDTMTEVLLFSVLASSNAVPLPVVNPSQGSGSAFLAYGQDGTQQTSVAIYRSDNGAVLCSVGSIIATGQTVGEADATNVIIHYSTGGTSHTQTCPRPLGKSTITPAALAFPDVYLGGCVTPAPTKQFTVKNSGNDCLTVNPISGSGPFAIQSTSVPLPATLSPGQSVTVTVAFNPVALGPVGPVPLSVTTVPANGDKKVDCSGNAKAADFAIAFSTHSVNFGTVPVGTPASKPVTIANTGHKPMTVSSAGVAADGFTVAPFSVTLDCGKSTPVSVQFQPASEGAHSASFVVNHSAASGSDTITLAGVGCVPNAEIVVPATAPIDFGHVQQGFRTVRVRTVQNTGDGALSFQAAISGPDAALFGLPDPAGSVINPPSMRTYSVNPQTPCGPLPSGSGETDVAISFFADGAPRLVNATLTISGHNATNFPAAQTWIFALTAEVTPPTPLDIGLVVDRSDSMNAALGSRVKIDAAVAASQLFVELLRPNVDDRVAFVRFNNTRDVVVPMSPVSTTVHPTQDEIRGQIDPGVRPAQGLTAIAGGTMLAIHEVEKPHPGNPSPLTRAVVVLTDGIENTAFEEPAGNWLSILGGTKYTPTAVTVNDTVATNPVTWPAGIKRYAVAIGYPGETDPNQLNALTADPSSVFYVDQDLTGLKYFQLEKYYTQIFMDVVGMPMVLDPMYWIAPGTKHQIEFEVLPGDVDAMVVIYDYEGNRLPFFCVSPKGEILDPAAVPPGFQLRAGFTSQARFVQFRMPPKEPNRYAGTWKVVIVHDGTVCFGSPDVGGHAARGERDKSNARLGFLPRECRQGTKSPMLYGIAIGVGSDFRMVPFVTPAPVYVGDPILLTAMVSEAGLPVRGCTVTVEASAPNGAAYNYTLVDDGAHSDGGADDGEYAESFTKTLVPGIYHFKFRAVGMSREGKQVVREAVRDKPVFERGRPTGGGYDQPGGRPTDGHNPPPKPDCCHEILKQLTEQNQPARRPIK
jgi:hypothetical protein